MCLSTVYKNTVTPETVAMKNVMKIECQGDMVILTDLMERQMAIHGELVMANLVEGVDLSALDLVVDAHTILAIRILFAVGVGHDDTAPIAAGLRDLPGAVLPVLRVLVTNQYVHRARIDGFHAPPP